MQSCRPGKFCCLERLKFNSGQEPCSFKMRNSKVVPCHKTVFCCFEPVVRPCCGETAHFSFDPACTCLALPKFWGLQDSEYFCDKVNNQMKRTSSARTGTVAVEVQAIDSAAVDHAPKTQTIERLEHDDLIEKIRNERVIDMIQKQPVHESAGTFHARDRANSYLWVMQNRAESQGISERGSVMYFDKVRVHSLRTSVQRCALIALLCRCRAKCAGRCTRGISSLSKGWSVGIQVSLSVCRFFIGLLTFPFATALCQDTCCALPCCFSWKECYGERVYYTPRDTAICKLCCASVAYRHLENAEHAAQYLNDGRTEFDAAMKDVPKVRPTFHGCSCR